jgi:hypothetical protein
VAHDTRYRATSAPLLSWRADLLRKAGFDAALADRLAADATRDLHALIGLTELGCPPHLAARILAPLDEGGRSR